MPRTSAIRKTKPAATAAITITLPELAKGEMHGGLFFKDGKPSHFVIVLPGDTSGTHDHCVAWATERNGDLPTRKEQSLLMACAAERFKKDWYWSSEVHASDAEFAWGQGFTYGGQHCWHKSGKYRAVAVRRIPI